jgi:hypothetical protein
MATEQDLTIYFFGRVECPYCARYVACFATHRCSTEQAAPARVPVLDHEPIARLNRWKGKSV